MTCKEARVLLGPYIDQELTPTEGEVLDAHLEACRPCSRRATFEVAFNRMLRESLEEEPVPPSLLQRVRRHLLNEERATLRRTRLRFLRPAAAWALAASLAVAYLLPAGLGQLPGWAGWKALVAGSAHSLQGILICLECDQAGVPLARQGDCNAPGHHAGLRTGSGDRWSFTPGGAVAGLVAHPELRGTRVRIEGRTHPRAHVVDVVAYEFDSTG